MHLVGFTVGTYVSLLLLSLEKLKYQWQLKENSNSNSACICSKVKHVDISLSYLGRTYAIFDNTSLYLTSAKETGWKTV